MITIVFWTFYAGACLGAAIVGWTAAEDDGLSVVPQTLVAIAYAIIAPAYVGMIAAGMIIGQVRKP